jgi:hypothetical protein
MIHVMLRRIMPAIKSRLSQRKRTVVIFVLGFVAIGAVFTLRSHAATIPIAFEAEFGALSAGTTMVSDSSASGGSAVKFNTHQEFVHPGVFLNAAQLDFVKTKLAQSDPNNPNTWDKAYTSLNSWATKTSGEVASDGTTPIPYPNANLNLNCATAMPVCNDLQNDGAAAYTQALMCYYKNVRAACSHSAVILNAWSAHLQGYDPGDEGDRLELAWSGEIIVRAAELLRYTYTPQMGETAFNWQAFATMLNTVYLPAFAPTTSANTANGNWDLSMIDATMNIAVFTDNHELFQTAIGRWNDRVPAYIYLTKDGAQPVPPPRNNMSTDSTKYANELACYWTGAGSIGGGSPCSTVASGLKYVNGMVQETCRDSGHVALGLYALTNAAETATIQGVDLYGQQQGRIVAGLEFSAQFDNAAIAANGVWQNSPCGRQPPSSDGGGTAVGEVPLANYEQLGVPMPNVVCSLTGKSTSGITCPIAGRRPVKGGLDTWFETLTNAVQ